MPAQKPVPGVVRVSCSGTYDDAVWANIFHIGKPSSGSRPIQSLPWPQADVDLLVVLMHNAYAANFLPLFNATVSITQVVAQDLSDAYGVVATDSRQASGTAPNAESSPANAALVISWREALHYRGGHLRSYLPPPPQAAMSSTTTWSPTQVTQALTAATNFRTQIANDQTVDSTNGIIMTGVHRYKDHQELAEPVVTQIVGELVDSRIDSMRRRLGRDR